MSNAIDFAMFDTYPSPPVSTVTALRRERAKFRSIERCAREANEKAQRELIQLQKDSDDAFCRVLQGQIDAWGVKAVKTAKWLAANDESNDNYAINQDRHAKLHAAIDENAQRIASMGRAVMPPF